MADINKLKDKIKSTIYPNGKGAINASDHQAMLLDMADGMAETDTKVAELSGVGASIKSHTMQGLVDLSMLPSIPYIDDGGSWISNKDIFKSVIFPCYGGVTYKVKGNAQHPSIISVVQNLPTNSGESVIYANNETRRVIYNAGEIEFITPDNAKYIVMQSAYGTADRTPQLFEVVSTISTKLMAAETEIKKLLEIRGQKDFTQGYLITNKEVGSKIDLNAVTEHDDFGYALVSVIEGEQYHVFGQGGTTPLLWAVVDKNNILLSRSGVEENATSGVVVNIPTDGSILVVQARASKVRKISAMPNYNIERIAVALQKSSAPYNSIKMEDGYYLDTTGEIGTTFSYKITKASYYECATIPCVEGQQFIINAEGSDYSAKPYTFLDADNVVLSNSGYATKVHSIITAPSGACFLVINNRNKDLRSHVIDANVVIQNAANIIRLKKAVIDTNDILPYRNADSSYPTCWFLIDNIEDNNNRVVTATAIYSGTPPTIQFLIDDIYKSTKYIIGSKDFKSTKQWRIPPVVSGKQIVIRLEIPNGTQLFIDKFSCAIDNTKQSWNGGVRLDSHLGLQSLAPENTMIAFEMAAQCNNPACIVNPIRSKDGTWYCYHDFDETLTLDGINYVALSDVEFQNLTDAEIAKYRVGGLKEGHRKVYSEPIPLLEDFFCLCAKTGMRPMFSTHPTPTKEGWLQIKNMLVKYGLLNLMTVKAATLYILELAYSVLGDIEGYIYDVSGIEVDAYCDEFDNSALSAFKGRKAIEYIQSTMTENVAQRTIERGYIPSVWSVGNISGQRYYDLLSWGVMEFTDDNNASSGLNW